MGGKGLSIGYQLHTRTVLSAGFSRFWSPVWGSSGGQKGGLNGLSILRKNGGCERHAFVSGAVIEPGDTILITTANGGGWGRPT